MKSFKEYIQEVRSVGIIPASTTKKLKQDAERRKRDPWHRIGTQLKANLEKIKADAELRAKQDD